VIAESPPLAAVEFPIVSVGVPPLQIVSPVAAIAPAAKADLTVTTCEAQAVVLQDPLL
jgi:hypothetical protein